MRLDISINSGEHKGRYSYSEREGFLKTIKENIIKGQIDLMVSEKTFRLAIKKEHESPMTFQEIG